MRDAKTKFNTQHNRELLWDLSMQSLTAVGDEVIERQGLSRCSRRRRGGLIIETMDRVVQERSMGNRSRLRPRARRGGGLRTRNLVDATANGPVRSSVVGQPCPAL
jgi:hypothetical protein